MQLSFGQLASVLPELLHHRTSSVSAAALITETYGAACGPWLAAVLLRGLDAAARRWPRCRQTRRAPSAASPEITKE